MWHQPWNKVAESKETLSESEKMLHSGKKFGKLVTYEDPKERKEIPSDPP